MEIAPSVSANFVDRHRQVELRARGICSEPRGGEAPSAVLDEDAETAAGLKEHFREVIAAVSRAERLAQGWCLARAKLEQNDLQAGRHCRICRAVADAPAHLAKDGLRYGDRPARLLQSLQVARAQPGRRRPGVLRRQRDRQGGA